MNCHADKLMICMRLGDKFVLPIPRVCSISIVNWCDQSGLTECRPEDAIGEIATIVRNPYDKCVSNYYTRAPSAQKDAPLFWADTMSFEQFVEELPTCRDVHVLPQSELVPRRSFVGRFENLREDWRRLCEWLGVAQRPLRHLHKSHEREARDHFTPHTRALVEAYYARDFEAFGY